MDRLEKMPIEHTLNFSYILGLLKSHKKKYFYISDEQDISSFALIRKQKGVENLHDADEKKYLVPSSYVASKSLDINFRNKINSM